MASLRTSLRAALSGLLRSGDDTLADFRERIAFDLSLIAAVLLLPFGVLQFAGGHLALAGTLMAVVTMLGFGCRALRQGRTPPISLGWMSMALAATVCFSIAMQGMNAVPWTFPTIFASFFVLKRRLALSLSVLLLLTSSALTAVFVGWPVALRMIAAMTMTLMMINVVLNVIGELQAALVAQAITDPLTGAFNRRHFSQQVGLMRAPPAAAGELTNVMLALDLDHFKSINDRHGHVVGDAVLQGLVTVLNRHIRTSDRLFRTGGEEFVLLLPRIRMVDAQRLAEDLRQRIEAEPLVADHQVTVSIGVAAQPVGDEPSAWLRAADDALYRAKNGGRNRVVVSARREAQAPLRIATSPEA